MCGYLQILAYVMSRDYYINRNQTKLQFDPSSSFETWWMDEARVCVKPGSYMLRLARSTPSDLN